MSDEEPEAAAGEPVEETPAVVVDAGLDPVWGVCLGVFGLFNMAIGGAFTFHWWFNFGELFMLVGTGLFLVSLALTSTKQRPLGLAERLREWRERDD